MGERAGGRWATDCRQRGFGSGCPWEQRERGCPRRSGASSKACLGVGRERSWLFFFLSFKRYLLNSCYQPVMQWGGPLSLRRTQRKGQQPTPSSTSPLSSRHRPDTVVPTPSGSTLSPPSSPGRWALSFSCESFGAGAERRSSWARVLVKEGDKGQAGRVRCVGAGGGWETRGTR